MNCIATTPIQANLKETKNVTALYTELRDLVVLLNNKVDMNLDLVYGECKPFDSASIPLAPSNWGDKMSELVYITESTLSRVDMLGAVLQRQLGGYGLEDR